MCLLNKYISSSDGRPSPDSQDEWGVKSAPGFTQVLGLPVTIFPDMCLVHSNAWLRYPHINP
jgi:hypothetical protein